jgi:hypothetical protein
MLKALAVGILIGTLGGLIGLGGAEFRPYRHEISGSNLRASDAMVACREKPKSRDEPQ